MKRNEISIIGLCSVLLLAACTDDSDGRQGQDESIISFETTVPLFQTRGLINTNGDMQSEGFGVFAYYTGSEEWTEASSPAPNFMYNQKVEWNDPAWTYTPVKYWPNDNNPADVSGATGSVTHSYLSFFAYAPYKSTGITVLQYQPLISYTWTNNVNPSSQSDLLYASQKDCYKTRDDGWGFVSGRVPFHFCHALAAIEFKVRRKDATGEVICLTSLSLNSADTTAVSSSQASLNTSGSFNLVTAEWVRTSLTTSTPTISYLEDSSSSPERHDINSSLISPGIGVTDVTPYYLTNYTPNLLLMMPQETTVSIPFTLSYTLDGTPKSPSGTITFTQPTGGWALAMGKKYTVIFVIDGGEVESYLLRAKEAEQW